MARKGDAMRGTPVTRRLLGAALRRHRVGRGFSLDDAARMLGCDRSKVSRIETGMRGVREHDLLNLLAEYGVREDERAALLAIAGPRAAGGWWHGYAGVLPPAAVEYLGLEAAASQLLVYEGQRVPALLRADRYSRAIAEHDPVVPVGAAGAVAEITALRQRTVLGPGRKELVMVIGEAALRQRVGGAKVMGSQLARLAELGERDGPLTIQVLPFISGAHAGAGAGPLTIFRFAQAPGLGIVHLDGVSGGTFLDSPDDLDAHTMAFTRLRASALGPEESSSLLRRMAVL
jgi:transcriptional regulator with XRE-family HTH domain